MNTTDERRQSAIQYFRNLQDQICAELERLDEKAHFREDNWVRQEGGGGRSRVLTDGGLFEKAGVNFSDVFGQMSPDFAAQIPGEGTAFTAAGISVVLHPLNPFVPTIHMNLRYLTKGDRNWFGGGADLTPYYPFREDVIHFHRTWKQVCERHKPSADYASFKQACDKYFFLPHRNEARGVGGIFFDYLERDGPADFAFVREAGEHFLPAYVPIVERRRGTPFGERHRAFQEYRRGRYVEFNLIYDRGTLFGLKTGGRVESILMSLPPVVRWEYDYVPQPGSEEAELSAHYLKPRDWAEEPG
jgi:coproporphyrinogen III oxidase